MLVVVLVAVEITDAVIRFAGNSQDGIQTIGGFLAKLAGRSAREVMTYMTIPSTIAGGPSIFQVHLASGEVLSSGDEADFLFVFYQHSYDDHLGSLRDGGICIYDSVHVTPDENDKRVRYVGIPITSITVEALGGTAKDRGKNMLVLGLVTALFQLDRSKLISLIEGQFKSKGEDVLRNAMIAFDAGYAYQVGDLHGESFNLKAGTSKNKNQVTTDGNTALALGLVAGGVRFGAAYPITPWTTVMEHLRSELPKHGGLFVQTEDELAAVSMTLGFSYAGHLAVTGSSGPGLSLKMEALGYGSMAELPMIVVNVQRGGPSTGMPTSVEQSDLMQAIYGSHGDSPRVVIAPINVEDCFYTAIEACRLARKCSAPVIILTDQALATRIEAFQEPNLEEVVIAPELALETRPEDFQPYPLDGQTHHAPPGSKMASGKYPVVTGLEHDAWGHPSGNPEMHQRMVERRREKISKLADDFPATEVFGDASGDVLLVGWGSTWGPIREATIRARDKGLAYSSLSVRHLSPMPNDLGDIFNQFKHIIVIEMNDAGLYGYGQLATLLRARHANPNILSITKTDGLTFKIKDILKRTETLLS
ncbi:MAG: 2-oxoacid:acceptor oxidoreductase subunit alpha [Planctomycetes bacterium]|nr:2-oxoacid:acceptor oxidoreductase subunit alpha [Planctomycetota bacterium]